MLNMYFQSGIFGWLMLLCTLSSFVFTIVSVNLIFIEKSSNIEKVKEYLNMIVWPGMLAAAIGFNGTIFGGYQAIWEIMEASNISMRIVWQGVNLALSSTILGFSICILSSLVWLILRTRVALKMS